MTNDSDVIQQQLDNYFNSDKEELMLSVGLNKTKKNMRNLIDDPMIYWNNRYIRDSFVLLSMVACNILILQPSVRADTPAYLYEIIPSNVKKCCILTEIKSKKNYLEALNEQRKYLEATQNK